MDNDLTIGYWAIRGLGQPIRAFAQYLGVAYKEVLYTEWNNWAQDSQKFNKPFANLPYIKNGEEVIYESDACFYYLAQIAGKPETVGKDAKQQTQVAFARGILLDFQQLFIPFVYDAENFEKNKQAKLIELDDYFVGFENILKHQAYLAGDSITYVDFRLWEYIDEFLLFNPETIQSKPSLVAYHKKIAEIPQIQNFINSPSYIKRPFNGEEAAFK